MIDLTVIGKFPRKSGKFHRKHLYEPCLIYKLKAGIISSISMKEISLTFLESSQEITTIHVGTMDSQAISDRVTSPTSTKRQPNYHKWTKKERYTIGKYAAENGNINAVRKFKPDFPALGKSSVRSFKKKYYEELKYKTKEDLEASQSIPKYSQQTGRPHLLGDLDEMVKTYLLTLSKRGG